MRRLQIGMWNLAQRNPNFHVTFEHNPQMVSKQDLHRCYDAVDELLHASAHNL